MKPLYSLEDGALIKRRDHLDVHPECIYPLNVKEADFRSYLRAFALHPENDHTTFEHITFSRYKDNIRIQASPDGFFDLPTTHALAIVLGAQ